VQTQLRQHHLIAEFFESLPHGIAARFGVEHLFHARLNGARALARRIDPDRAAVARNRSGMKNFETVHLEQVLDAAHRVVAQVLVIDRVVLQHFEELDEIVRFRDEHAVGRQHLDDAFDDGVNILDVGEAVRAGDDLGGAVLFLHLTGDGLAEIALQGRNAAAVGDLRHVCRLDAENAMATVLEIGNERAVVRADIDDKIILAEAKHLG